MVVSMSNFFEINLRNLLYVIDYQFTREMLLTNLGETYIKDDLTEA